MTDKTARYVAAAKMRLTEFIEAIEEVRLFGPERVFLRDLAAPTLLTGIKADIDDNKTRQLAMRLHDMPADHLLQFDFTPIVHARPHDFQVDWSNVAECSNFGAVHQILLEEQCPQQIDVRVAVTELARASSGREFVSASTAAGTFAVEGNDTPLNWQRVDEAFPGCRKPTLAAVWLRKLESYSLKPLRTQHALNRVSAMTPVAA